MLKCASIFTYEIDDPGAAFEELKGQLDQKITLLEHSVGIILCHPEFIASGVVKHLGEKLPFNLAGVTTSAQAVNGEAAELVLTLFIMTSDDVWFKTSMTESLEENVEERIKTAVNTTILGASELPALALVFAPLIGNDPGDIYMEAMQKALPNVPIFGPIAVDDSLTFELSETIYNGENHKTSMPFILCYGNINPRFIVGTFPEDKVMPYKGEVTKANGPLVCEINNMSAFKYFENLGLVNNGNLAESFGFVPFAFDQKKRADYDGIPVIRAVASLNKDGTATFRGGIDEGSTFTIMTSEAEDVLMETQKKINLINNMPNTNGTLIFSCIARRMMTMHIDPLFEPKTAKDTLPPGIPFLMGYAGGEISPTLVRNGIPTNRFHNFSLVILVV